MGKKKYSDKQIEALREFYPKGEWDQLLSFFPEQSKVNIRALARRLGLKQTEKKPLSEQDITGQRFEKLVAIHVDTTKEKPRCWICQCDCGKRTSVPIYSLIKGETKSCGCLRNRPAVNALDLTGQRFGMLTAVERLPHYRGNVVYYRCICDCGKTDVFVSTANLRNGHTVSCGTHHHSRSEYWRIHHPYDEDKRTYVVYRHISPNGKSYIGITKQDPERRFQSGNGYKTQAPFWRAIVKYGWENFKHEVLEQGLTEKEASEREKYYIEEVFHSFAPKGYNVAEGGTTGRKIVNPIIQYYYGDAVNFFESITKASRLLGIALETIHSHEGEENAVNGYWFEHLPPMHTYEIPSQYLLLIDESHYDMKSVIADNLREVTITRNLTGSKPINKYDLNGHYICSYQSIAEARKSIKGSDGGGICAAVNPNRQGDAAYGYMWRYDTGDHSDIEPIKYKKKHAVLQIDAKTGQVIKEYPSMSSAARAIHSSTAQIGQACRGERDTWHGFVWRIKGEQ